jgi:predicted transposase YbfD/YdcC
VIRGAAGIPWWRFWVLAACATLVVGNDCVTAIWQWAAGTGQDVLARIGARYDGWTGRYLVPSEATFRRVLTRVDGDALDCADSGYVTDVLAGAAPTPVLPAAGGPAEREQRRAVTRQVTHPAPAGLLPAAALDRKLLHGSVTDGGRVFLVAAIDHTTGAILRQRQVADKRGENTALQPLLSTLDTGRVWTLDALHTSKKTARLITGPLHGHYILILKGNQPLVLQAAQALLSGTDTQFAEHTDWATDRGHGRTEHRTLRVAACDDRLFPGARQVFRLRRDTGGLDGVRTSKEIVYGIASLSADLAGPAHLNHYTRQHWCVENRLHWIRDVVFGEDASTQNWHRTPRDGYLPQFGSQHDPVRPGGIRPDRMGRVSAGRAPAGQTTPAPPATLPAPPTHKAAAPAACSPRGYTPRSPTPPATSPATKPCPTATAATTTLRPSTSRG